MKRIIVATLLALAAAASAAGQEIRFPAQLAEAITFTVDVPQITSPTSSTYVRVDFELHGYGGTLDPASQVWATYDNASTPDQRNFRLLGGNNEVNWDEDSYIARFTVDGSVFTVEFRPESGGQQWSQDEAFTVELGNGEDDLGDALVATDDFQFDVRAYVYEAGAETDLEMAKSDVSLARTGFDLELNGGTENVDITEPWAHGELSTAVAVASGTVTSHPELDFTLHWGYANGAAGTPPTGLSNSVGYFTDLPESFDPTAKSAGSFALRPDNPPTSSASEDTVIYVWAQDPISSDYISPRMTITYDIRDPYLSITPEPPGSDSVSGNVGVLETIDFTVANLGGGSIDVELDDQPEFLHGIHPGYAAGHFVIPTEADNISTVAIGDLEHDAGRTFRVLYVPTDASIPGTTDLTFPFTVTRTPAPTSTNDDVQAEVTVSQPGAAAGENFSIVAVLDRSGSMRQETNCPQDPGFGTKMEGLKTATGLFYDIMRTMYQPGDHSGVVIYNHGASPLNTAGLAPVSSSWIDGIVGANPPPPDGLVNDLSAGGATSISDGLVTALEWLTESDAPAKSILLMTDGRHNTPELDLANDFAARVASIGNTALRNAVESEVAATRVFSVGLGEGQTMSASNLKNLAMGSSNPGNPAGLMYDFLEGGYRYSCSTTTLGIFFAQVLADTIVQAQIIDDDPGEVTLGTPEAYTIPVNTAADRGVFYVTWTDTRAEVSFTLSPPGGLEADRPVRFPSDNHDGYAFFSAPNLAALASKYDLPVAGEWTLVVNAAAADDAGNPPDKVAIEYAAMITDTALRAEFAIDPAPHTTGGPVTLTATISEGGAPVYGADVAVLARVPGVGLGDFIYENEVAGDTEVYVESSDGSQAPDSDAAMQLDALLAENPDGLAYVTIPLGLNDAGNDGDATAGDGVYTRMLATAGISEETENNGVYSYRFIASGTDLRGKRFERTTVVSDYVTSIPDPAATQTAYYYGSGSTAFVHFTPRDQFGHYVDPAPGRSYEVVALQPDVLDFQTVSVADQLDGTFVAEIEATTGTFSPYLRTADLVELRPVNPPGLESKAAASFTVPLFHHVGALEVAGGRLGLPASRPELPGWGVGVRFRLMPHPIFGAELESLLTQTENASADELLLVQYGINAAINVPLNLGRFRPYVTLGGGGLTTLGTSARTSLQLTGGGGFRYYPDYRMAGGVSLELRDVLLWDTTAGLSNGFQFLVGAHANLF